MSKKVKGTIARVLLGVAAMAFVVGGAAIDTPWLAVPAVVLIGAAFMIDD